MKKFRGILAVLLMGLTVAVLVVSAQFAGQSHDVTSGENAIADKVAGGFVIPREFNNITGTIRGLFNVFDGTNHFFGLNRAPVANVTLDLDGPMQLGKMSTATCGVARAGAMYFDTDDHHFWYCDGSTWRQLDTNDCSTCSQGYEYTCGVAGTWSGGVTACTSTDYDNTGGTLYSTDQLVCSSEVPNDQYCGNSGGGLCVPVDLAYETKCYNGDVWQYDDCGNRVGFGAVNSCGGSGCTNTFTNELLPDGTSTYQVLVNGVLTTQPMHPQYASGIEGIANPGDGGFIGTDMTCSGEWNDPYPADSYNWHRSPGVCIAPGGENDFLDKNGLMLSPLRIREILNNYQMAAFCGDTLSCGAADGVPSSTAPTTGLCDAGEIVGPIQDGKAFNADKWAWSCHTNTDWPRFVYADNAGAPTEWNQQTFGSNLLMQSENNASMYGSGTGLVARFLNEGSTAIEFISPRNIDNSELSNISFWMNEEEMDKIFNLEISLGDDQDNYGQPQIFPGLQGDDYGVVNDNPINGFQRVLLSPQALLNTGFFPSSTFNKLVIKIELANGQTSSNGNIKIDDIALYPTENIIACFAPQIDWQTSPWSGMCVGGVESREVTCVNPGDLGSGEYNDTDCLTYVGSKPATTRNCLEIYACTKNGNWIVSDIKPACSPATEYDSSASYGTGDWACSGNVPDDSTCKSSPVCGAADGGTSYPASGDLCSVGIAGAISTSSGAQGGSTTYSWTCSNDGEVVNCSSQTVVNGSCSTYSGVYSSQPANNTNNGCDNGNGGYYSDVSDTSTEWKWQCNGSNGGSNVICAASVATYSCTSGVPTNATLCSGDDSGLSSDTTRTAVDTCTASVKCEYACNSGYHESGGSCILTETYHWDIGDWGACSTTSGGSGTGVGSSGPYSSCFIANTKVNMADGTIKNIQEVKIGDILKGQKTNNTVLGFHQPKLGDKKLYSFNGGKYFVTAEHPFMTTEGWKAFNPELAQKEHHLNIKIGQLALGDTLVTEKGNIVLKTVDTKSDKADTQLYNFILDGDHTYYADGYLVHNKIVCANNDANCGSSNSICYNSSDGLVDMSNLHNDICSHTCSTPGSTAVAGGCDYNSTQTEAYCGEDLQVHCRVPVSNSTGGNGGTTLGSAMSVATRTVVCKNSSNDTVDDSFCTEPKPPVSSDDSSLEGGNFCSQSNSNPGHLFVCGLDGSWKMGPSADSTIPASISNYERSNECLGATDPINNDAGVGGYDFYNPDMRCWNAVPGNCSCFGDVNNPAAHC